MLSSFTLLVGAAACSSQETLPSGRDVAYASAERELSAFIESWGRSDLYTTARQYVVPEQRPSAPPSALLHSGRVVSVQPHTWASTDHFTMLVSLDLHFDPAPTGNFTDGLNTRFVTCTRPVGVART